MKRVLLSLFILGNTVCVLSLKAQTIPIPQKNAFLPNPFKIKEGIAVFVDFKQAKYQIIYDIPRKKVYYLATIQFQSYYNGNPVFDVVKNPKKILLNGFPVSARPVVTPDQETTVRVLNRSVIPGIYEMIIEGEIEHDVTFERNGSVSSGFWYNDQVDRSFLEKYLPTNLEYDQYKISIELTQLGMQRQQIIYTNGKITPTDKPETILIDFPDYLNANSLYFHLLEESTTTEVSAKYTSPRTHKIIPVTIYGIMASQTDLTQAMNATLRILTQLEVEIGPYPYEKLLIHLVPEDLGGVEYVSAVVSEQKNLRHEIFHQYLSRGFMPANGNAGWIDEAVATWYDRNKPVNAEMKNNYNLANQNTYTRTTDNKSYTHGVEFIAYLHQYLLSQGKGTGFMGYLQFIAGNRINRLYTTQSFIQDMEKFYRIPLEPVFKKYVF